MGIFGGNPQNEPMHYGEVFGIWTYLSTTKALYVKYQTLVNHTGDEDLRNLLNDAIHNMKPEMDQIEKVLKVNGVGLPPTAPERPSATLEEIPVGARFNDSEIAAAFARDMAMGLVACSSIMGESIREDIAAMFAQFHAAKAQYGLRILRLNKEKGWLIPPPLHTNVPEPVHS